MSSMSEQLLDTVRADPDNDAPRLVYADWLSEQGDEDRGEFVRVQCAMAKLRPWDREYARLEARERVLLSAHEETWRAELPEIPEVHWGRFRRGFVDRAHVEDYDALRAHGDTLKRATVLDGLAILWPSPTDVPALDAMGVRELIVIGTSFSEDEPAALAGAACLAKLRELVLLENMLDEDAFAALISSPHLAGLRSLKMPFHMLGELDALLGAKLPALTELDFSVATLDALGSGGRDFDTIGPDAMAVLAAWTGLEKLRSLDLSGNQIGAEGLGTLLASPKLGALEALFVREINDEEGEGDVPQAFRDAHASLSLRVLGLKPDFDAAGARLLGEAKCLEKLAHLDVSPPYDGRCAIGPLIEGAAWMDAVQVLDARRGNAGILGSLVKRSPKALHTLLLSETLGWRKKRDAEVTNFVDHPASNGLVRLDLAGSRLSADTYAAIGRAKGLQNLLWLDLSGYEDAPPGVDAHLAATPLGQRLSVLTVGTSYDKTPVNEPYAIDCDMYDGTLSEL